ncbi:MAG TPA: carboxypeptidase regulatory-like domain-containing protein [Thermoanaerobaculia bacterium]|nr:carboxypeptidase regulatory-like domain-containing protein [Thermoanaerobaculia bacterium]
MRFMVMLLLLATFSARAEGTIEATIRGTKQPLEVDLFLRGSDDSWSEVEHARLPPGERRVRFDDLAPGVYQLLLRGPGATEQLGTKIALGTNDVRRTTIEVQPFTLSGEVSFGDTAHRGGVLFRHRELGWRAGVTLDEHGSFRVPMWQRGTFVTEVRGPALPTAYTDTLEIDGKTIHIVVPDGRIKGIVRDAENGAPLAGATIALQTKLEGREEHAHLITGPDGRFDFAGIRYGRHTVRVFTGEHLEPEAVTFTLGDDARLRELEFRVQRGRTLAVMVLDRNEDPAANAQIFAVTEARVRARTTTDADGRATVALPNGEAATLFVVPEEGPFAMLRIARDAEHGRVPIHLPHTTSSLHLKTQTTSGGAMPPIALLLRYNGEMIPQAVAEELGVVLMTGADGEAHLENIPSGGYELWPYRTDDEAESILAAAPAMLAPIQVNVRTGENRIAVKFAPKRASR